MLFNLGGWTFLDPESDAENGGADDSEDEEVRFESFLTQSLF